MDLQNLTEGPHLLYILTSVWVLRTQKRCSKYKFFKFLMAKSWKKGKKAMNLQQNSAKKVFF